VLPDLIFQTLRTLTAAIPPPGQRALARGLGAVQYRLSPTRRAGILQNLSAIADARPPLLASPAERDRAAREVFASYQLTWVEYLGGAGGRGPAGTERFRLRNSDLLYRAVARGRGAVIAAPHVGSWELAGLAFARLGLTVHVVTGVQLHARLTHAVRALKERHRIRVSTPRDGFGPLIATLREGGVVVLLVDGDIYARSIPATFLGRRVALPAGPAILCRRARAPLLHAHAAREENGGHSITFDALDTMDPQLALRADLSRLTQRVATVLENTVASNPTQWCAFHPLKAADRA
jgi:phosphatidylinositol dimannoside acyltransferase